MDCQICSYNILNLQILEEKEESYSFLFNHGFFAERPDCRKCGSATKMKMCRRKEHWVCYKKRDETQPDGNIVTFQCNFRKSIFAGTSLENSKLAVKKVALLIKLYLENKFIMDQAVEIVQVNKTQ